MLPFGRDGRALSFRHNDLYNTDRATGTWFGLRVTVAAWGVEVCNSAAELHVHNVPAYLGPWLTIIQLLLWRFCWAVRALASRFLFCSHTHTRILYNHRPSVANTIVCGGGWWLKHDRTCASEVVGGGGDGGFWVLIFDVGFIVMEGKRRVWAWAWAWALFRPVYGHRRSSSSSSNIFVQHLTHTSGRARAPEIRSHATRAHVADMSHCESHSFWAPSSHTPFIHSSKTSNATTTNRLTSMVRKNGITNQRKHNTHTKKTQPHSMPNAHL